MCLEWEARLGNQLMFFLFACDKTFVEFELFYDITYILLTVSHQILFSLFSAFWRMEHCV